MGDQDNRTCERPASRLAPLAIPPALPLGHNAAGNQKSHGSGEYVTGSWGEGGATNAVSVLDILTVNTEESNAGDVEIYHDLLARGTRALVCLWLTLPLRAVLEDKESSKKIAIAHHSMNCLSNRRESSSMIDFLDQNLTDV